METKQSKGLERKGLIAAIRKAVEAEGGRRIPLRRLTAVSKFREYHIVQHFGTWNEALKAAGFDFERYNRVRTDAELFTDWGCLARKLGRAPLWDEYKLHGKYGASTIVRRFGHWSRVPDAFRKFAKGAPEWADVLAMLPKPGGCPRRMRNPPRPVRFGPPDHRLGDRPVCGVLIDVPGLLHAPTNELGVVLLFGALAPRLGFMVESLQARFPDCEAKRLTRQNEWQSVRIEFEYESRNFRDHGHDTDQCDLIVCWEHNWPACPPNLEVIALKNEVERLRSAAALC